MLMACRPWVDVESIRCQSVPLHEGTAEGRPIDRGFLVAALIHALHGQGIAFGDASLRLGIPLSQTETSSTRIERTALDLCRIGLLHQTVVDVRKGRGSGAQMHRKKTGGRSQLFFLTSVRPRLARRSISMASSSANSMRSASSSTVSSSSRLA